MTFKKTLFDMYCNAVRLSGIRPLPKVIVWEPTARCNLRCYMCTYYGIEGVKPCQDELSLEHVKVMWENIAKHYRFIKPIIGITGGEPFMRKDIIKILRFMKSLGMTPSVTTNAVLLNKNTIRTLAAENLVREIIVSLDVPEERKVKVHGTQGTFDKVIGNIGFLRKSGIKTMINCVILKDNIVRLIDMANLAFELHVPIRFQHQIFTDDKRIAAQNVVTQTLFGKAIPTWLNKRPFNKMEVEELKKQIEVLQRYNFIFEPAISLNDLEKYYFNLGWTRKKRCVSVFGSARINALGKVYPCFDYCFGDAVKTDFRKIWDESGYFLKVMNGHKLFPGCARCCKL